MIRKGYLLLFIYIFIFTAPNLLAEKQARGSNTNNNLALAEFVQDSSGVNSNILKQNYPNPFNPTTTIQFNLPERSYVELNIYNVLGIKVTTLVKGVREAGTYSVIFNASKYPSGLYIYELQTNKFKQTKKMIYMK